MVKDYYQILGIEQNADEEAIKSAYRKLARQYHPDSHEFDPNEEIAFHEIDEAYEVLRDPVNRAKYDETLGNSTSAMPKKTDQSWRYAYRPPATSRPVEVVSGENLMQVWIGLMVLLCTVIFCGSLFVLMGTIEEQDLPTTGWSRTTATVESVVHVRCEDHTPSCRNIFYRYEIDEQVYQDFMVASRVDFEAGETFTLEYKNDEPQRNVLVKERPEKSIWDEWVALLLMFVAVIGIVSGLSVSVASE